MKKAKSGPKVRSVVAIPADLVAVAKVESALRLLKYHCEREEVWRLVGARMSFTVKP